MRRSTESDQHGVFLFTDTQIKQEAFLEDINNLLNRYACSAGLKRVQLMQQHRAHSRNRPTAADGKSSLSVLIVISLVSTILGKSLKLLPPDVIF